MTKDERNICTILAAINTRATFFVEITMRSKKLGISRIHMLGIVFLLTGVVFHTIYYLFLFLRSAKYFLIKYTPRMQTCPRDMIAAMKKGCALFWGSPLALMKVVWF